MLCEKTDAFAKSAIASTAATARDARLDQITLAGIKPLRQKTRPNVARLTKAGPKSPVRRGGMTVLAFGVWCLAVCGPAWSRP